MGYAVPGQRGTGIHLRLKARAFAFADDNKRFMFVSLDGGMGSDLINKRVLERLNEKLGKDVYTYVRLSCTVSLNSLVVNPFLISHHRTPFPSVAPTPTPDLPDFSSTSCTRSPLWAT